MLVMAKITVGRVGELLRALFGILAQAPEGLQAGEAVRRLAKSVTLTAYELEPYPTSGVQRFDKVVRFASMHCVKAGWMIKDQGIWAVTPAGCKAIADYSDPEAFYNQAKQVDQAQTISKRVSRASEDIESEAERSADVTYDQAKEEAWAKIEQYLHLMSPFEFQDLVADLLKGMGYHVLWKAPPGPDGGIDIIAAADPLGTKSPRIKVQVRRTNAKVDLDAVKAFAVMLQDMDVGIFVSAGGFTSPADQFARQQAKQCITLITLKRLVALWVEFFSRLDDIARRRFPLTPIYFLTPEE
jgi:restriction system protein